MRFINPNFIIHLIHFIFGAIHLLKLFFLGAARPLSFYFVVSNCDFLFHRHSTRSLSNDLKIKNFFMFTIFYITASSI